MARAGQQRQRRRHRARGPERRATAVEQDYTLYNPGIGVRGSIAGGWIGATPEYGHGFSGVRRLDGVDGVSASLTLAL